MPPPADRLLDLNPDRLAEALGVKSLDLELALAEVGVDGGYLARALLEGDPQGALPAVARRLKIRKADLVSALVKAVAPGAVADADGLTRLLDAAIRELTDADRPRERVSLKPAGDREASRRREAARAPRPFPAEAAASGGGRGPEPARPDAASPVAPGGSGGPAGHRVRVGALLDRRAGRALRRASLAVGAFGLALASFGVVGLAAPGPFLKALPYALASFLLLAGAALVVGAWRVRRSAAKLEGEASPRR